MSQIPSPKKGVKRIWAAFFYSVDGLCFAFSNEAAFREELIGVVISVLALLFVPFPLMWKCVLLFATITILVVELLNSAIEAIVDLVSPGYHEAAKHAKDLGSAAVLVSIIVTCILWCVAIYECLL